jgi:hypothetical protein
MIGRAGYAALLVCALCCGCSRDDRVSAATPREQTPRVTPPTANKAAPVQIAMQHVRHHVAEGIVPAHAT